MRPAALLLAVVLAAAGCVQPQTTAHATTGVVVANPEAAQRPQPLAGRVVVLDPGHQLGNRNFPRQVNRPVPAGGFRKPCNATGTTTDAGFPEATFTWLVARQVQRQLRALGARVLLTRHRNSERRWGPCVDVRGRAGNREHADLKLSIHADGNLGDDAHGFHVIYPPDRRPWTHDIHADSASLARTTRTVLHRAGLPWATYVGRRGLDERADLGTLNLSDVPTVLVELGNMRDAGDARRMTSARGRGVYAGALVDAVEAWLRRR